MNKLCLTALMVLGMTISSAADDAARDWSQSMSYQSPSQQAVDFNKAQAEYLLREGIIPGSSTVTVNNNCEVAGACQQGGSATNINGYSSIVVEGNGNSVEVDIEAESDQDATSTTNVVDDISNIEIQ